MNEFEKKGDGICADLRRCYFRHGLSPTIAAISQYLSLAPISMRDNTNIHSLVLEVFGMNTFQRLEEIRTMKGIQTMDKIKVLKFIGAIYKNEEFWYEMIIKSPVLAKMYQTDDPMFKETMALVK